MRTTHCETWSLGHWNVNFLCSSQTKRQLDKSFLKQVAQSRRQLETCYKTKIQTVKNRRGETSKIIKSIYQNLQQGRNSVLQFVEDKNKLHVKKITL